MLKQFLTDIQSVYGMPSVTLDLMCRETKRNGPFFERVTREYFEYTQTRMRKFPLAKQDQYGVALCVLPATFDEYFMAIEASGRRNVRKAKKNGYSFERIRFNDHLDGVKAIWQSADVRQGQVPDYVAKGQVKPSQNPETKTNVHDYPYFGVLKDGELVAYAGCLVAGDLCAIEQIYGHAEYQNQGVVPMVITGIVGYALEHYPKVKVYTYDNFFGASETLRRFKKKFGFVPHKVKWVLGE